MIALTIEPDLTNFLNISNFTSSRLNMSVIFFIIKGFLKSGLSVPYFSNATLYEFWETSHITFFLMKTY